MVVSNTKMLFTPHEYSTKSSLFGSASPLLRDKFEADSWFVRLFFGYPSLIRERSLNEQQPKLLRSRTEAVSTAGRMVSEGKILIWYYLDHHIKKIKSRPKNNEDFNLNPDHI
ncbi:hypothetical protein DDZ16_15400 [Marinilabilia rubra]|uniref:Uncharacterized protein n=1 Tax=Marinilabilia rubra TaxID=2162893 RepID=A0A2U2B601_9BACT|nr:hypothetical protein DDZ16_15400 [Marinilabilia rubra]